jgi:lambda repressor-like predicted transcriptional regulator
MNTIRDSINKALQEKGWTIHRLSTEAKISSSTLARFLRKEDPKDIRTENACACFAVLSLDVVPVMREDDF